MQWTLDLAKDRRTCIPRSYIVQSLLMEHVIGLLDLFASGHLTSQEIAIIINMHSQTLNIVQSSWDMIVICICSSKIAVHNYTSRLARETSLIVILYGGPYFPAMVPILPGPGVPKFYDTGPAPGPSAIIMLNSPAPVP